MDLLVGVAGVLFVVSGLGYATWLWIKDIFGLHEEPKSEPSIQAKPAPKPQPAAARPVVASSTAATSATSSALTGSTWLALGVAGLSLIAILPFPIGFYTFLRVVVAGSALYLVTLLWERHRAFAGWLIAVAVLFNPIIPVWLTKEIWAVLNFGAAVVFLTAAWKVQHLTSSLASRNSSRN